MLNTENIPIIHAPFLGVVFFMSINMPTTALAKPLMKMINPARFVKKNMTAINSLLYNFPIV
jgi:hypothetical protein